MRVDLSFWIALVYSYNDNTPDCHRPLSSARLRSTRLYLRPSPRPFSPASGEKVADRPDEGGLEFGDTGLADGGGTIRAEAACGRSNSTA